MQPWNRSRIVKLGNFLCEEQGLVFNQEPCLIYGCFLYNSLVAPPEVRNGSNKKRFTSIECTLINESSQNCDEMHSTWPLAAVPLCVLWLGRLCDTSPLCATRPIDLGMKRYVYLRKYTPRSYCLLANPDPQSEPSIDRWSKQCDTSVSNCFFTFTDC
jgi:hypothetical protein